VQLGAGRRPVALGEDQVDHLEHHVEPGGPVGRGRGPQRDAGDRHLGLGPGQPGRHGRLADQEQPGDLGGRQAGHEAQHQRRARVGPQRRVAAGEQHPQLLVVAVRRWFPPRIRDQQREPAGVGLLAPEPVQRPPVRRRPQPGARVRRHALLGPHPGRRHERVLEAVLGHVEPPQPGHEQGEQA
jgi:hypothetical protein